MKVAVIGMGNMGSNYAVMISSGKVPGMELKAITRVKEEKFRQIRNNLPENLLIYESSDALFQAYDDGELLIDSVIVVTPNYSHEEISIKAFERGISVLCDKPSGVYSRQAREMQNSYFEQKKHYPELKFGMIFQQRTSGIFKKMKEIAESRVYGNLKRANWTVTDWFRPDAYYSADSWKAKWKTDGGGVILNQCPHNLDILKWICGMPSGVLAVCQEGKNHPIEVEDEATAFFEWSNGVTGVFTASTGEAAGLNRLELIFENARLVCEDNQLRAFELKKTETELKRETVNFFARPEGEWKTIPVENHNDQYADLLENFARGNLIADGQDGLDNLLISNAIYLSSWESKKIVIPKNAAEEMLAFERAFESNFEIKKS